jgi:superfamily II DNA or RNA helicase
MIIAPQQTCTPLVARLTAGRSGVFAVLPEVNERFIKTVKKIGYSWDSERRAWYRRLDDLSGPIPDRIIETAATLAEAGFSIELEDDLAKRLQAGEWRPECKRWVIVAGNALGLRWRGEDDNLYRWALSLPDAHWDKDHKAVVVAPVYYAEVIGFAETHGFGLGPGVQAMLDQAARDYARVILPAIPAPAPAPTAKSRKKVWRCDPQKFMDIPARNLQTTTDLYPHQVAAVEKLLQVRVGAFFMDMGTGKTRCAIELAARRQARISKVVWFCPVSLKLTIAAEIAKHTTGEAVHVFDDATSDSNLPAAFWYIVGIESMSSSDRVVLAVDKLIDADTFVIVDESSYIKGHASKRSMRIAKLGEPARYRLLLTGTPISQGVEDLYAQMRFLSPDILGYSSFYSFAHAHLEYSDKYPGLIVRAHGVGSLAEKVSPYVHQVTKAECLTLPGKLYDQVFFYLTAEQREAYELAKAEILLDKDPDDLSSYVIFQLFTALQQVVSGFWNRDGQLLELPHRRLDALKTALNGISDDEKVIIWTKYIYSLRQISSALPGCAVYYGDLSEQERQAQIDRFRSDAASRYLVATQATGGHGLTLNEAHYHVFYENEFKYSHRIQAEDRSHRIGQAFPVTYIDLYSDSGIDDRIRKALEKKEDAVRAFRREVQKHKGASREL